MGQQPPHFQTELEHAEALYTNFPGRGGRCKGQKVCFQGRHWRLGSACISSSSGSGRLPSLIFKNHPTTTCSCTVGKWEEVKEKGWWESGKNLSGSSATSLQTPAEGGEEGAGLEHPQRNGEGGGAPPFSRGWVPFTRRERLPPPHLLGLWPLDAETSPDRAAPVPRGAMQRPRRVPGDGEHPRGPRGPETAPRTPEPREQKPFPTPPPPLSRVRREPWGARFSPRPLAADPPKHADPGRPDAHPDQEAFGKLCMQVCVCVYACMYVCMYVCVRESESVCVCCARAQGFCPYPGQGPGSPVGGPECSGFRNGTARPPRSIMPFFRPLLASEKPGARRLTLPIPGAL